MLFGNAVVNLRVLVPLTWVDLLFGPCQVALLPMEEKDIKQSMTNHSFATSDLHQQRLIDLVVRHFPPTHLQHQEPINQYKYPDSVLYAIYHVEIRDRNRFRKLLHFWTVGDGSQGQV